MTEITAEECNYILNNYIPTTRDPAESYLIAARCKLVKWQLEHGMLDVGNEEVRLLLVELGLRHD